MYSCLSVCLYVCLPTLSLPNQWTNINETWHANAPGTLHGHLNFVECKTISPIKANKLCGSKFQLISYRWRKYQSLGEELRSV